MNGLYKLKTDEQKERNGVPVKFVDATNNDGTVPTIYVRPVGCDEHNKAMAKHNKPIARQLELGQVSDDKKAELARISFAEGCIAGWDYMQDENGAPIEFTVNNVDQVLKDLRTVYNRCLGMATDEAAYRVDSNEAAAKN